MKGIRNPQDFWAGIMFIAFGLVAVIVARDYPMGAAMRMGPGYFPTYLGAILIVIGAIVSALSFRTPGEPMGRWGWRGLVMLSLAFAAYGLFMENLELGFVPSLLAVIVLSTLATREFRVVETLLLALVLIAGTVGLFIYGLELPYPLFWWR